MIKIIYTVGMQSSGKSTWAKKFCQENLNYKRLNKDSIRLMFGFKWDKNIENDVHKIQNQIFESYLKNGWNIVVDNTGFHKSQLTDLIKIARKYCYKHIQFELLYFPIELNEAIERDSKRGDESVGENVIRDYWNRFGKNSQQIINSLQKDIDEFNSMVPNYEPVEPNIRKIPAIIVDMDGTLAHLNNRSPFDFHKCDTDIVDETVKKLIKNYDELGYYIIIVSGRENIDGEIKKKTEKWLIDNCIPFDEIFMREHGDMRPDSITKYEIFDKHIRPRYNIEFCVDDRNQVVNMWRDIGLKCFQVADGDF